MRGPTCLAVMRGLDPRIHHFSDDGLPGLVPSAPPGNDGWKDKR
jgi:hypothetical protein